MMNKEEYRKYIYNMLTFENKVKLHTKDFSNKLKMKLSRKLFVGFDKDIVLDDLIKFHQTTTFANEENYYDIILEDLNNYLADKTEYCKIFSQVMEEKRAERRTGEFYKDNYYLGFLKFDDTYEWLNKEAKEEYKPFICAKNSGISGRIPILKTKEKEIINEAFRLLYINFDEYGGACHTDYMDMDKYPYQYIGKEGMIKLYNKFLEEAKNYENR